MVVLKGDDALWVRFVECLDKPTNNALAEMRTPIVYLNWRRRQKRLFKKTPHKLKTVSHDITRAVRDLDVEKLAREFRSRVGKEHLGYRVPTVNQNW